MTVNRSTCEACSGSGRRLNSAGEGKLSVAMTGDEHVCLDCAGTGIGLPPEEHNSPFAIIVDPSLPKNVLCIGYYNKDFKGMRVNPEVRARNECEKREHPRSES